MKYSELNHSTCTVQDVITVSVGMHPSSLIECLSAQARVHVDYSCTVHEPELAMAARRLGKACMSACSLISEGGNSREIAIAICNSEDMRGCVFPAAAKLLLIPAYLHQTIKARKES